MATRLYLRAASYSHGGDVPINQTGGSAPALQGGFSLQTYPTGADATSVSRSLSKTKGSSQTSIQITSTATNATKSYYVTKFISDPLEAQTITAETWDFRLGIAESNSNMNLLGINPVELYVWRPSTGALVNYISDSATLTGFAEPSAINTNKLNKGTVSGSSVTVQEGDVIIFELWFRLTQGTSTAYNATAYFDGTTEYVSDASNTTVSDIASYIETPQDLTFTTDAPPEPIQMTLVQSSLIKDFGLVTI